MLFLRFKRKCIYIIPSLGSNMKLKCMDCLAILDKIKHGRDNYYYECEYCDLAIRIVEEE